MYPWLFLDQTGFELRHFLASASRVLGLKVCTTIPGSHGLHLKGTLPNPALILDKEYAALVHDSMNSGNLVLMGLFY